MRAAGRHTVPPGDPQAGPTARLPTRIPPRRPGNRRMPCGPAHLADPATAARHATSLTLQPRQSPPAMRTSPPCRPGNRRPPFDQPHLAAPAIAACHADQPTLQTRQPPPARHAALPPYRPNRCRTAQAVPMRSGRLFHGPAAPPQPKGAEGTAERARSWQGSRRGGVAEGRGRGGKRSRREGTTEGRGAIGRPAAVSGMGLRRVWRSFFAGFVPFASLNIRFERVQTASQPYFYSRKRFTPRPHTHQIQPVAAPRQRSAPAGGSRDRHPLRLEDSLPFRPSVRHPETHGSGCRFVGS